MIQFLLFIQIDIVCSRLTHGLGFRGDIWNKYHTNNVEKILQSFIVFHHWNGTKGVINFAD